MRVKSDNFFYCISILTYVIKFITRFGFFFTYKYGFRNEQVDRFTGF